MLDTTAIRRLKNGDIGGLETLITRYQVTEVRTAFLIVHDEQLAEDIVQDAFIRIYQRIRGFIEWAPRSRSRSILDCSSSELFYSTYFSLTMVRILL